jgi:DNA replication and repair protein RecF
LALIERLRIRRFRNLADIELVPGSGVSWLVGANASGKTALLEAIYCLSRGRSFRGKRHGPLVMRGATGARVEGLVERAGLRRTIEWSIGVRGGAERGPPVSEFQLPVRLICESTHALVEGEPSLRRRFLDWNLGLSEQDAVQVFSRFRRAAAQRNAWLRAGGRGRAIWDRAYADTLAELLERRLGMLARLDDGLQRLVRGTGWFEELSVDWEGPDADALAILTKLEAMRDADRERGFTYLGASRCDFALRSDGSRWVGSRGQGKVAGTLLQLAADQVVSEATGASSVWLVDDIEAELGADWVVRLLEMLRQHGRQMVVTSLPGKAALRDGRCAEDQMFHVEQGRLKAPSNGAV